MFFVVISAFYTYYEETRISGSLLKSCVEMCFLMVSLCIFVVILLVCTCFRGEYLDLGVDVVVA